MNECLRAGPEVEEGVRSGLCHSLWERKSTRSSRLKGTGHVVPESRIFRRPRQLRRTWTCQAQQLTWYLPAPPGHRSLDGEPTLPNYWQCLFTPRHTLGPNWSMCWHSDGLIMQTKPGSQNSWLAGILKGTLTGSRLLRKIHLKVFWMATSEGGDKARHSSLLPVSYIHPKT